MPGAAYAGGGPFAGGPSVVAKDAPAAAGLRRSTKRPSKSPRTRTTTASLAAASVFLGQAAAVAVERDELTNRVVVSAAALDGTCALATQLFGRAQTRRLHRAAGVGEARPRGLRYARPPRRNRRHLSRGRSNAGSTRRAAAAAPTGAVRDNLRRVGAALERAGLALARAVAGPLRGPAAALERRSTQRLEGPRRRQPAPRRVRGVMLRCRRVYFGTVLRRDVTVVFAPSTVTMEWRSVTSGPLHPRPMMPT